MDLRNGPVWVRKPWAVGLVVVVALLGAGTAMAVGLIPDADGVIHACYKQDGTVRLVASSAECKRAEQWVSWSQQGPKGEPGNMNLAGQACPAGEFVTGFDAAGDIVCAQPVADPEPPDDPTGCPANNSSDVFVDPSAPQEEGMDPTGVSEPASCRFTTFGAAIDALTSRNVTGGRIIATGEGTVVFEGEEFPLVLPDDTIVTTSDDPDLGGTGLDGSRFVLSFDDPGASSAVRLQGGALRGLTVYTDRAQDESALVVCAGGVTELTTVVLDGSGGHGLLLESGCELSATELRVKGSAEDGIVVESDARLSATSVKVHDNGRDGLAIYGEAYIEWSIFAFNGRNGISVHASPDAVFRGNDVRDNGRSGFQVWPSEVSFISNFIHNNSRSNGWHEPQLEFHGPGTFNFGENLTIDDCSGTRPNVVYSYNTLDTAQRTVGLFATNQATVHANWNRWQTQDPFQNVRTNSDSFVEASQFCSPFNRTDPDPGPPVD